MNDNNRGSGGGSIRCCCGSDLLCNGDRFPGEKATVLDSVAKRSVMDRDTIAAAAAQLPALAAGIANTRHNCIIHTTAASLDRFVPLTSKTSCTTFRYHLNGP
jgi:hypothetical protein